MNIIAETPRLIIRLFNADEEETYLDLYTDERVMQYLPYRSPEEHRQIFYDNLAPADNATGRWGIFSKDDNKFIGMCLLRLFDDGSDSIELGYAIGYDYWGKGIASEMAEAVLAWALKKDPKAEFVAVTDLDNTSSQRVLEKIGMQRTGYYYRNDIKLALFRVAPAR